MTEAEWLASDDPWAMLNGLQGIATLRKLRLFACGSCRLIWGLLGPEARAAVEAMERFAEQQASKQEVAAAKAAAYAAALRDVDTWYGPVSGSLDVQTVAHWHPAVAVAIPRATAVYRFGWVARYVEDVAERFSRRAQQQREEVDLPVVEVPPVRQEIVALMRCVFGNPFRPASIAPHRRSSSAASLARTMYEEQLFSPLPILADALEEAGCDNADVLAHCRGLGPHVRGCWVVDRILGKQ